MRGVHTPSALRRGWLIPTIPKKICVSLQSKKTIIELEDTYHVQPVDVGFMFSGTDAEIQVLEVCPRTK